MQQQKPVEEDKPPLFRSWRTLYGLVIGALILQIALFYAITNYFE